MLITPIRGPKSRYTSWEYTNQSPADYDTDLLWLTSPPLETAPSNTIVAVVIWKMSKTIGWLSDTASLHASCHLLPIVWQNATNSTTRTLVLLITPLMLAGILCEKHVFGGLMIMTFILLFVCFAICNYFHLT